MLVGAALEAETGVMLSTAAEAIGPKAEPATVAIQAEAALGYCQAMTPASQPLATASETQVARVAGAT